MTKHPANPAIEYASATVMRAISMTRFPEIGKVADELKMLTIPVPRPASGEVAIEIAASAMHIDEIFAAQGTALGRFYGPKMFRNPIQRYWVLAPRAKLSGWVKT